MGTPNESIQSQLDALGEALQQLLKKYDRLCEENRSLRVSQEQLAGERAGLLARSEQARSRVETMIQRLKSLENAG
ncbi:MAG TPA: TIGR02449 family protein [Rhodanobacteraceae bacterium]|nr:TIGR02449 family protein [Rhodanobacteraceae bacterium]